MDDATVTAGVLLEAAQNQQKIAEASFAKLDALAKIVGELPQGALPELKASIEGAIRKELAEARQEIQRLTESLRKAHAHLGQTLLYYGGAVVLIAVVAVAVMLLWALPAPGEMVRLRDEKAQLQASIADLAKRGGRIQLRPCVRTDAKSRLCARVDPAGGTFNEHGETYMVLAGY